MNRQLPLLWLSLLATLPLPALADARARGEIAAAKQAAETRYRAAEADCRRLFLVTPCIDEARAERRKALASVRERELQLDDIERRQRAAARQEAVARKKAVAASAAAAASAARVAPAAAAASAPAASAPPSAASASRAPLLGPARPAAAAASAPRAPIDGSSDVVASRAERSAKRQQEAQARRERIAAREAERLAQRKAASSPAAAQKSAPLPGP